MLKELKLSELSLRKSSLPKVELVAESGITYGGSDVENWLTEHLSSAELADKFVVLLQTHHHTHIEISQTELKSVLSERKPSDTLEKWFTERADRWEKYSLAFSSPSAAFLNKDYQQILGRGMPIIGALLKRLQTSNNDWIWALENIVPEELNPPKEMDSFAAAVQAWLEWGRNHNYIA